MLQTPLLKPVLFDAKMGQLSKIPNHHFSIHFGETRSSTFPAKNFKGNMPTSEPNRLMLMLSNLDVSE